MIISSLFQKKVESRYLENIGKPTKTIIMEDYIDSKTPISCSCLNCGNQWSALPCSLYRHSCPKCWRCKASVTPKRDPYNDDTERAKSSEDKSNNEPENSNEPEATQLEKDLEDSKIPYEELTDEQKNADTFLYVLLLKEGDKRFFKIGITNNLRRRIQEITRESGFQVSLHKANEIKYGRAFLMEKVLKKRLRFYQIDPKCRFRGYTECFSLCFQVVNKLLEKNIIKFPSKLPKVNLKGIEICDVLNWYGLPIEV